MQKAAHAAFLFGEPKTVTVRTVSHDNASAFAPTAVCSVAVKIIGTTGCGYFWPRAPAVAVRYGSHRHTRSIPAAAGSS